MSGIPKTVFAFGTDPNDFLREVVAQLPAGRTLCLGDGEGRNGVFLAQHGHDVVTIDLSPVGVVKARRLAADRGVSIDARVADLAEFNLGNNDWGCIVSVFCHLPPALRHAVHSAVPVALRAGGCFVLEAYRSANIGRCVGGPQNAEMTVELEDILGDIGSAHGISVLIGREVERSIVEGKYHKGMSATTQVLARKH